MNQIIEALWGGRATSTSFAAGSSTACAAAALGFSGISKAKIAVALAVSAVSLAAPLLLEHRIYETDHLGLSHRFGD